MANKDDLISLVQALPQELFDQIYELTFTPSNNEHYIDREYKPPSCLQVSRQFRKQLAPSYYGKGSIFYVRKRDCLQWLVSLSEMERGNTLKLAEVRILDLSVRRVPGEIDNLGNLSDLFWFTGMQVRSLDKPKNGIQANNVDPSVLKIKAIDEVEGWTSWISEQEAYDLYRSGTVGGREWRTENEI